MGELHLVNYKPYHQLALKPQGFKEFCDMVETNGQITGLWEIVQADRLTGRVIQRVWNKNVVTDQGAINLLSRAINSSAATLPNLFNNILITNNSGSTTLTTGLTNGQTNITSLAVASLPASIPAGTTLTIGYGSGQTQNITTSAAASQGATSISVNSFTSNAAYSIGTAVVPNPSVTDNPTNAQLTANVSPAVSAYSGNLATGAFVFTPTSGQGNRTLQIQFLFTNAGGTPVGNYTDAWLINVSSAATTNNYLAHEINTPSRCDASNTLTTTIQIKI